MSHITGDKGNLSKSYEELMSGEDFARLVHITGGVEAYCKLSGQTPETVHANMQEGKIMYVLETKKPTGEEIARFQQELGMNDRQFAAYIGLPPATLQEWKNEP